MSEIKYFNRELSWIEFNKRVLAQALNKELPLMERLQFLSIVTSNFDEFFRVRVAGYKRLVAAGVNTTDNSGYSPKSLLDEISKNAHALIKTQYDCLTGDILPNLTKERLIFTKTNEFTSAQLDYSRDYFQTQILPLLTPLRTDELFPNVKNLALYVAFLLDPIKKNAINGDGDNLQKIALVEVPESCPHIIMLPTDSKKAIKPFCLTSDLTALFGTELFAGYDVKESLTFRVARDADFAVDEDGGGDFIHEMEKVLIQRKSSFVVTLVTGDTSKTLQNHIASVLELDATDIYEVPSVVNISNLMELRAQDNNKKLSFPEWKHFYPNNLPQNDPYWDTLKTRDILLSVPYQSYDPVVKFITDASRDPQVLAIKMTLYRAGSSSPIIDALEKAARSGKQVIVLVELKARFDEERNITWAARLENAGATVIYGLAHLKVHAKIMLIIRREGDTIMRYVHMATGNYNVKTATLYSDLSIFTSNFLIAQDATNFFNLVTGYSTLQNMRYLFMAPVTLKQELLRMIDNEIQKHKTCHNGFICAKMNSLTDIEIIDALYKASESGVKIALNIRGICMLRPGLNYSKNITVVSIVGRYLEHSRIFYFQNGTTPVTYLSSADWMERNLDRRIELMFPILDKNVEKEVKGILDTYFMDNTNSSTLTDSNQWVPTVTKDTSDFCAQDALYNRYKKSSTQKIHKSNFLVRRRDKPKQ